MNKLLSAICVAQLLLSGHFARGENWPAWRGPLEGGVAPGQGYPIEWGEEKNIEFKVKLPGWGTSTPIVWGDKIFVSTVDEPNNALVCLNRAGEILWKATCGTAGQHKNRKASAANPSPVSDGKHVFVYYKSGDLACLDFDGKTVWHINLQEAYGRDQLNWDLGTSPVLTENNVVVAVMHAGPSYVAAFDKQTGKEIWKQDRDLGAPGESRDSYTTPLVVDENGQQIVVVLGADFVTAHAATTGEQVWQVGTLNPRRIGNFRSIASPVVAGDLLIAPYARGGTLTAIQPGAGEANQAKVVWTVDGPSADVPTPAALDGKVYICGDRGDVSCVDLQTGNELWTESLPRNRFPYSSSPLIAEGRLYATREDGTTFVIKLGDKPEVLAENALNEYAYATPAFVDGKIYMRTSEYLICIAEK